MTTFHPLGRLRALLLVAVILWAACADAAPAPVEPADPGPPTVREAALEEHALTLDGEELRRRPAGSGAESLAGTYLLGHLHAAGYATVLDPVPVADLVRSTNIVAVAPAGPAPSVVVVTPYDTPEQGALSGGALAVFLEVARALRMAEPGHEVSFVALGAEHAQVQDGRLGSRRLAREMLDEDLAPLVISIDEVEPEAPIAAAGDRADDFLAAAAGGGVAAAETAERLPGDDVFTRAGFEHLMVRGDQASLARVLLAYLQG
jgi:hypothetical protein